MDKKVIKELAFLVLLIIICTIGARFLAHGETLEEYAKKNPQAADNASFEASGIIRIIPSLDDENPQKEAISDESDPSDDKSESAASQNDSAAVSSTKEINEEDAMTSAQAMEKASTAEIDSPDKYEYNTGFYYESLPQHIVDKITNVSYVENDNISLSDLRYCVLLYNDFNNETQRGELICNKAIAQDVMEIFYELYTSGYQIESVKLIDEFDGDDHASMLANNTSCFNYRVVDNTTRLSKHAYGLAVDLNPFYNPYITYPKDGTVNISPEGSEPYADRTKDFPYKIDENDLAYKLFKAHGFKWGGNWNSVKDYQHFERSN